MIREVLLYATYVMAVMPAIFYLFKKPNALDLKYIAPFVYLQAFSFLYEFIVTRQIGIDSTIWFKAYTCLEFICLYYFYDRLTDKKYTVLLKTFLWIFMSLFIGLLVFWLVTGNSRTDSWLTIIETLLVYSASFLWFKDIFTNMNLTTLWDSPAFYFISGFILYFSGTFFLFLMSDIVFTRKEMNKHWIINVILSLILYIIIASGIWKGHQKSHPYSG